MKSKPKKSKKHTYPDAMPPVFVPPKKKKPRKKAKKRVREIRYESDKGTALIRG